ncbi:DUF3226 domain-containing protein [Larkinella sp. C7]|jgi:hypothetical protein|uniref:DUF3226 domain-containing protein n=1 Tax=Larkinella sp. C7 TaxID=2576607 RepID=UPI001111393D|nr:DUF3226 domain-containing protein [Larkinella sp. C7]
MSPVQIFVEGVADQKFLQDLIFEWYGVEMALGSMYKAGDILELEGKDAFDSANKLKRLIPIFQTLAITGKSALVIFDADEFSVNHANLLAHSQIHGFRFFLFPNNELDGDLETLLESLIHPGNQVIFDCWQAYEDCLKSKETAMTNTGKFTTPARKTKIYAYLEALLDDSDSQKEKIKERKRDYREVRHWNIDPINPVLKPLKDFLDPFFAGAL